MKLKLTLIFFLAVLVFIELFEEDKTITVIEKPNKISAFTGAEINIPVKLVYNINGGGFNVVTLEKVKVTAYNNHVDQTNNQPNVGASNRKVYEGSIALSRDILKTQGVKFGNVACIVKTGKCYFIEDVMNKRYDNTVTPGSGNRADIFMYSKKEALKTNFVSDIIVFKQK